MKPRLQGGSAASANHGITAVMLAGLLLPIGMCAYFYF
jgi:hypothetical protein